MASKGSAPLENEEGLWNLHAGWLKVSPVKQGFLGYQKDPTIGGMGGVAGVKRWKDRWAVVNSTKVCLFMDERCIQATSVYKLGPKATVTLWTGPDSKPEAVRHCVARCCFWSALTVASSLCGGK